LAGVNSWLSLRSGWVSDHLRQFGERIGNARSKRHVGPKVVKAPADVLDEGVACDDNPWQCDPASVRASGGVEP